MGKAKAACKGTFYLTGTPGAEVFRSYGLLAAHNPGQEVVSAHPRTPLGGTIGTSRTNANKRARSETQRSVARGEPWRIRGALVVPLEVSAAAVSWNTTTGSSPPGCFPRATRRQPGPSPRPNQETRSTPTTACDLLPRYELISTMGHCPVVAGRFLSGVCVNKERHTMLVDRSCVPLLVGLSEYLRFISSYLILSAIFLSHFPIFKSYSVRWLMRRAACRIMQMQ